MSGIGDAGGIGDIGDEARQGWFQRLKSGLSRSSSNLQGNITSVFTGRRKLDAGALEALEEVLIAADMGVETSMALAETLNKTRFGKDVSEEEVRQTLADEIAKILTPVAKSLVINPDHQPEVILVCGVNGTGKTTTIGKLAQQLINDGKRVMLAAGDTFRAAAIEQLEVWGRRTDCPVIANAPGSDAAGLAFEALEKAKAAGVDVLLIDTAGRLHNKSALMDELAKIVRVLKKQNPDAPHQTLLVLDATTGQNAKAQVETFQSMVPLTGLVVTKLDGTARGGVVVALARQFGLPVHAVGVGEGVYDLRPFEAGNFAAALLGLEKSSD